MSLSECRDCGKEIGLTGAGRCDACYEKLDREQKYHLAIDLMKTKTLTCTVVPKSELTDELKALGEDCDVMGYASVETVDRDSDIVRVAGISLANHRADSPVKLLASHQRTLPNGESPVIGRVMSFKQVTHKALNVPALAFSAKFAPTPLGKHYKSLYESGDMTDFSIGFRPTKAEPIKDGGLDYQQSELMEISAVALPANAYAGVMRAFDETYPAPTAEIVKTLEALADRFEELLDTFESASVVKAKAAEQPADHKTSAADESAEKTPSLADLVNAIQALQSKK